MEEEEDEGGPTAPFWMITFADLVTLLMTFFILILSFSNTEVVKFQAALSYFQGGTGVLDLSSAIPNTQKGGSQSNNKHRRREQAAKQEELIEKLQEDGMTDKIEIDMTEDGLHVTIMDSLLFLSGRAYLLPGAFPVLRDVADILGSDVEEIVVEGHTDNIAIRTQKFPSNWELSGGRAASVVRFLQTTETALAPDQYVVIGLGQYHPKYSNATSLGRKSNRRVEIYFNWERTWQRETTPY